MNAFFARLGRAFRTERAGGLRRSGREGQRGMALIMITAVIAILTAVAVEFTYRERVSLHLAANARDELRAYYLARSATELSRLLLSFQKQVNQAAGQLGNLLGQATGDAAAGAQAASGMDIRLWEMVPIDCGMVQMFAGLTAGPPPEVNDPTAPVSTPFGDFEGSCEADISDEESKINVNQLDSALSGAVGATVTSLMTLVQDPKYDFLFDEADAHGVRMTRPELLVALRDFVDANENQENLVLDQGGLPSFVDGSGDETYYYSRFDPPYRPKNAPLDSVAELNAVAGVGDRFMRAFGEHLTVYTGKNAKLSATPKDMNDLCLRVILAADQKDQAARLCQDEVFMAGLWEQIELLRVMPGVGLTPQALKGLIEAAGVKTDPRVFGQTSAEVFGSGAETFKITAVGRVGDVEKTLITVVRMDSEADPMGRLLHWEER